MVATSPSSRYSEPGQEVTRTTEGYDNVSPSTSAPQQSPPNRKLNRKKALYIFLGILLAIILICIILLFAILFADKAYEDAKRSAEEREERENEEKRQEENKTNEEKEKNRKKYEKEREKEKKKILDEWGKIKKSDYSNNNYLYEISLENYLDSEWNLANIQLDELKSKTNELTKLDPLTQANYRILQLELIVFEPRKKFDNLITKKQWNEALEKLVEFKMNVLKLKEMLGV